MNTTYIPTQEKEERVSKLMDDLDDSFILSNRLLKSISDKITVIRKLVSEGIPDEVVADAIRLLCAGFKVKILKMDYKDDISYKAESVSSNEFYYNDRPLVWLVNHEVCFEFDLPNPSKPPEPTPYEKVFKINGVDHSGDIKDID